jgi:uncharacterized protein YqjF (DUF2071 family)
MGKLMNVTGKIAQDASSLNFAAQQRLLSRPCEPLFYSDWRRAVFIHYEVDAALLQRHVPFALDLRDGRAFVSLVAFTMRRMRPRWGGAVAELLFRPIATHEFLNVRTYVRQSGEPGIYFLAEWLSNRMAVQLGPRSFGLPYQFGKLKYEHSHEQGEWRGHVSDATGRQRLSYRGRLATAEATGPSAPGTRDEFLLERYTAFTRRGATKRFFRIWHPPWPQAPLDVSILEDSLLTACWPWMADATLIGANYSPGVENVWMGYPHKLGEPA